MIEKEKLISPYQSSLEEINKKILELLKKKIIDLS